MLPRLSARSLLAPLFLSFALLALAGCKPGADASATSGDTAAAAPAQADALLADPRVGDLWAAELSHFSGGEFGDGAETTETVYGLMKVVEVTPEQVVLVTEDGAWPKKQGAINDLRGDLASISWDEGEKIPLKREEVAVLAGQGRILETRRLAQ